MSVRIGTYSAQRLAAQQFIETHDQFLVVSHVQPDGDAASSTCAIGWILRQYNKQFIMINEDPIPEKFKFLWGYDQVHQYSKDDKEVTKYKYVIAIDCADYSRIGKVSEKFDDDVQILNIDHHPTNDGYGTINLVKEDSAATAEILYDLIEQMKLPWNVDIAKCIYTGLVTDTGGFRYANTTPKVLEIAAALLHIGVNANEMAEVLLEKMKPKQISLLKIALNSLSFSHNKQISWVSITKQDLENIQASGEDMEGIVNYPRNIEGVEVGMFFKEMEENIVKVSFRSLGKVNVAALSQVFGGGGHVLASGATIEGSLKDVIQRVVSKVEEALMQ